MFAVAFCFALAVWDLVYGIVGELRGEFNSLGAGASRAVAFALFGVAAWRWPRHTGFVALVLAVPLGLAGLAFEGLPGLILFGGIPSLVGTFLITGARATAAGNRPAPETSAG